MNLAHPRARRLGLVVAAGVALVLATGLATWVGDDLQPLPQKELRMPTSNILVLYYSRTGTTAKLADAIARSMGADTERITDNVPRAGAFGFLRSLRDAIGKKGTTLNPLSVDPARYQLVVIGTPDWGKSVAAPTRTFLQTWHGKLPQVAFFLTDGTSDHAQVFADMAALVGRPPVATLGIAHDEVLAGRYQVQVTKFVQALRATVAEPEPAAQRF